MTQHARGRADCRPATALRHGLSGATLLETATAVGLGSGLPRPGSQVVGAMRRSKADVERYIASVQGSVPSPREVSWSWRPGWPPPWPCRGPAQRRRHGSRRPPLPGVLRRRPAPAVRWAAWRSRVRGEEGGRGGLPLAPALPLLPGLLLTVLIRRPVPGFLGCVRAASSPGSRACCLRRFSSRLPDS